MDVLFVRTVQLMHDAERKFGTGHEKKECVMHGVAELVRDSGIEIDMHVLDAFVDVVCIMARNKSMLSPLVRRCGCLN